MVAEQQQTAMRRKAQAGRALHQSRTVSVLKALRLTLSKVGNDLFLLPLATLGATQDIVQNDACTAVFKDDHLLILLDGQEGARGAVMVDPVLVGGLIQQQTMGTVRPASDGAQRPMTGTDASLIAPLINGLLERAAGLPETEVERAVLAGYRFGAKAQDVRLLMLALDAQSYHVIRLTLDMAKGTRQGELVFCLPVRPQAVDGPGDDAPDDEDAPPAPAKTLADAVMAVKSDLLVSVAQITLPISQAGALRVGDVLELGQVSFDMAQVRTRTGRALASGVLGQINGMRALRVKHREKKRETPQRRAADVDALADGGVYDAHFEATYAAQELPALAQLSPMPSVETAVPAAEPQMPDLSDLPGFEEDLPRPSQYKIG